MPGFGVSQKSCVGAHVIGIAVTGVSWSEHPGAVTGLADMVRLVEGDPEFDAVAEVLVGDAGEIREVVREEGVRPAADLL